MNIFLSELYKVWGKKAAWGFLLLLGMLNVAALFLCGTAKGLFVSTAGVSCFV